LNNTLYHSNIIIDYIYAKIKEGVILEGIKNQVCKIRRITMGLEQNFFGYYDIRAWDASGRYHLCHKADFLDRLPEKDDTARLGMIDIETGKFIPVSETSAFNFQQGSMFQWNPGEPEDEVVFNIHTDKGYKAVRKNVHTGKEKILEKPVANISPDGRFALSINFSRMFDFRPGYGYSGTADTNEDIDAPEDDGIFLTDMDTGKSRLVVSLAKIKDILTKHNSKAAKGKLLVNHINFNTDGSRFVFLARNFPTEDSHWKTAVMTADTDGSDIYLLSDYGYASHYNWRDPKHLLIHCSNKLGDELYLLKDRTKEAVVVDSEFFKEDGHCSYSPDSKWILYDSYPDSESFRHLYLYNTDTGTGITLASLYSMTPSTHDIRCDLHPRWHPSGEAISFDSTHEGHRHIYYMDIDKIMKNFSKYSV